MDKDIRNIVDRITESTGRKTDKVIPVLQAIQEEFNYLPEEALNHVCETTDITPATIYGVSTFYTQFRHRPVGKHIVRVCVGTACHVKGAGQVYDAIFRELQISEGNDTDPEGLFTVEKVACLGCCTIAPVVQIDDTTYGHLSTSTVPEMLKDFLNKKEAQTLSGAKTKETHHALQGEIRVGLGSCCVASGSALVKEELERSIKSLKVNVDVKHVGCVGICNQVPMLEIRKPDETPAYYTKIKAEEVYDIFYRHFKPANPFARIKNNLYNFFDRLTLDGFPLATKRYDADKRDTPVSEFLDGQVNIATEYRGVIKPSDIEEYKSLGGFTALKKCLHELTPIEIIDTIDASGLRGRGGAGFPSGIKWQLVNAMESEVKYVICNGDEGDPGAFMDRMLLESYPYRIIEGIIIAGYAVGASEGLFYIRAEYPLAVKRIREALEICEAEGILGEDIFGSDFSFNLTIFEGAGAFVCGEETALIASVQGKRGMPIVRPPYPAMSGYNNKPTLINNTETFSLITWIINKNAESFRKIGTERSSGTKVFALAGKINRGGLIEVPMGITIRKIVEDIGGGIAGGKAFKAVQIGGPSGGCIPASMSDTPVDFESLKKAGAMMGSGGLIVLDETDCMVDIARYFLSFTQDQSCGRCTFCRIGTRKMLDILNRICEGNGKPNDLEKLEELAVSIKKGSICGLGKSAPNPVITTLQYFREEYEAHLNGQCPTGKCKDLIIYSITDDCNGCTKCAQNCPADAIESKPYEQHEIKTEECIKCDGCRQVCPVDAVIIEQYDKN